MQPPVMVIPNAAIDPLVYVFGPEAGELFKGKKVRVTDENPKRVSVYDVIAVVSDVKKPYDTYNSMCSAHPEVSELTGNFHFTGQGQKAACPVTDVRGILQIINLLQGQKAAQFRASAIRLLVRFLGGDMSLIPEVEAIAQHHAEGRSKGTITQLCLETVQNEVKLHKYAFLSPKMEGKDLHDFDGKEACYLIVFTHEGTHYIKFGRTIDAYRRMTEHVREIPGAQLYCMMESTDVKQVEDTFRRKMVCCGCMVSLNIKDKKQTELLKGITPEEAEQAMCAINETVCDESDIAFRRFQIQSDIRMKELDVRLALINNVLSHKPELLSADMLMKLL